MIESRCGLLCGTCEYKDTHNCKGCIETKGHPFHGECPVAKCCQDKELLHCGQCELIPCSLLNDYSYDIEHGDNGNRIKQCIEWNS